MLSPEAYEAQLHFLQAVLPERSDEHCRHVFYEVARRDVRKALHELLRADTSLEDLTAAWLEFPRPDAATRRAQLSALLTHFCPNAAYQAVVRRAAKGEPLTVEPRVLERLRQFKRAPRRTHLEVWWANIGPQEEDLALFLLEELRYFSHALTPIWDIIDRYAKHPNPTLSRAALALLVRIPRGVERALPTLSALLRRPERQLHALQALQQARGLSPSLVQGLIQPIVAAYQDLERQVGAPNNLTAEYTLARNFARNNGLNLTLPRIDLGRQ